MIPDYCVKAMGVKWLRFFATPHMSMNDHERAMSIDFWVKNKF